MANITSSSTPRREFLQRISAGSAAILAGGLATPVARSENTVASTTSGDEWLERIRGDHRQVVDIVEMNDGFGFMYAINFLSSFDMVDHLSRADACAVAVFRHKAIALVMNDFIWEKYGIGARLEIMDPETDEPATRNIYLDGMEGYFTFEQAVNEMGVIVLACNMALTFGAKGGAESVGVDPDEAVQEWRDNLAEGVTLVPTGVYAVNRAQAHGCTYCYGG